jgi:hypothetical protein
MQELLNSIPIRLNYFYRYLLLGLFLVGILTIESAKSKIVNYDC